MITGFSTAPGDNIETDKDRPMPFQSEAQRRLLWLKHPEIARRWADENPGQRNLPYHKRKDRSKTAAMLGLLDLGSFIRKLASAAAAPAKPLGAVAGNDTLTSTQTLARGSAPNAASGISPGGLPSLGTPDSHNIQQQQQQPQMMPHAAPAANPATGPSTGQAAQPAPAQAAQAPAPAQAPGAFKPSAVFSVPHPPSVVANHHAAITNQFTSPAAAQQPKTAGFLLGLAAARLVKAAQPPYPNALPGGGTFQSGWYVPPSFQPGSAWPSGYRAPGYAGPETPGLPGFPMGMPGANVGMPTGYGTNSNQPNPFQALDDKAKQIEQAFISGRLTQSSYQKWQTYLQKQRGLVQKRVDLAAKNNPQIAAPDFQPPGESKAVPQDTYNTMQGQRAEREAEYAKRQAMQKEIDGYHTQGETAAREAYNKKFGTQTVAEFEALAAQDPEMAKLLERYKHNHLAAVMGPNFANATPEQKEEAWARDKQKLTVGQMVDTQAVDHNVRDGSVEKFYQSKYQDPAFQDLANNPAFQELQRKATAGDAGAKAELDKIRTNYRMNMDPSRLMDNPQMQLLQRTNPQRFNELMQHAQNWGQYNQDYQRDSAEWDKAKGAWGDYLGGAGSGGGAKGPGYSGDTTQDSVPDPNKPGQYLLPGLPQPVMSAPKVAPATTMPPPASAKSGPAGYTPTPPTQGVASAPGTLGAQPRAAAPQPVQPPATAPTSAPVPPAAAKPAPVGLLGSAGAVKPNNRPGTPPAGQTLGGAFSGGLDFRPPPPAAGANRGGLPPPSQVGSIKPAVKPPTIKPPSSPGLGGGAKPSVPGA